MLHYTDAFHRLKTILQPLYDPSEAAAIARETLLHITGRNYSQGLLNREEALPAAQEADFQSIAEKLVSGMPLQYALGFAWFMNRKFRVTEAVLIPRPETEELVQWIIDDWAEALDECSVLDIGTGSGCIPISLRLSLSRATITSCDVSKDALRIAAENSRALEAGINLLELDFLDEAARNGLAAYDVIVSNPPYIPEALKETLHPNVRDHEPGIALFVPDADPLIFYNAIAAFGKTHLKKGGAVYCELHAAHAAATTALFETAGYEPVQLREDINGHPRILKAVLRRN